MNISLSLMASRKKIKGIPVPFQDIRIILVHRDKQIQVVIPTTSRSQIIMIDTHNYESVGEPLLLSN